MARPIKLNLKMTDESLATARAMWNAGKPTYVIAKTVGLSHRTVQRWINALCESGDLKPRPRVFQAVKKTRPVEQHRCCLSCDRTFTSEGSHNRVCNLCKDTNAWRSGVSYWFAA